MDFVSLNIGVYDSIELSSRIEQPDNQMHGLVVVAQIRYPSGTWHTERALTNSLNSNLPRLPRYPRISTEKLLNQIKHADQTKCQVKCP